ncbi:hypothetical protein LJC11_03990 [Bacteroidales bacterium OttesenSCG-928-I21]|nr:hypothetical protein [Bacteroidales bacterium OttesenSCG-928-I21]
MVANKYKIILFISLFFLCAVSGNSAVINAELQVPYQNPYEYDAWVFSDELVSDVFYNDFGLTLGNSFQAQDNSTDCMKNPTEECCELYPGLPQCDCFVNPGEDCGGGVGEKAPIPTNCVILIFLVSLYGLRKYYLVRKKQKVIV